MKSYLRLAFILAGLIGCCAAVRGADTQPPTIQTVSPTPGVIGALTQITVTFSEPVVGISFEDFLVNGAATAIGMSGSNAVYTFTLEAQPLYGAVQISWDVNHHIFDLAVPQNRFDQTSPGASWQYTLVDTTAAVVTTLTPVAGVTMRQLTQIDVQFSEPVAGVEAADLLINDAPATQLAVLTASRYRFSFLQPTNGVVQVAWATNHGIHDYAVTPNAFAGGNWTYMLDPGFGLARMRINEFLTSSISTNGLKDEDGTLQDWIELYNFGTNTVNLAGYALTDDRDDAGKWTFPATNLAAGQYLVVFASEKNRKAPTGANRFHTNFRLNPFGNYLALFSPDSPRVALTEFAPEYPEQRNDYSYGYDSGGLLKYFSAPTPGATNGNSAITEIVPPPHFNVNRGLFDTPFTLLLNTPLVGAAIRYTTDGSDPSGTNSLVYSSALQITNTTMIRAAAFKTNMLPSLTITHTYIFLDSVLRQPTNPPGFPKDWGTATGAGFPNGIDPADYEMDPEIVTNAGYSDLMKPALRSLPTLSIVMNVEDIFGTNNGLYTHSSDSQTLYRGPAWERACSAEFILTNGQTGFQVNCGIQIQGNASRNPQKQPKHPFRVLFKGAWGPSSLDYQVFPDSSVTRFDSLVLRSDFNNSWTHWDTAQRNRGTRIRDGWAKDTIRAMDGLGGHTRHFHLYINGLYWGLYEFSEKADAGYAAAYLGGNKEDYDAIASKPTQAIDGDLLAYNAMVAIRNLADTNQYNLMLQYLDMTSFIDYMLLEFYGANQDWGLDGNWNAVRRRSTDGRFKYVLWDAERLVEATGDNRVSNTDVPGGLHTNLLLSAEYKLAFADRVQKHMFNGGALTTNALIARWLARAASVDAAIIAESARWGDYRRDGAAIGSQVGATGPYLLYTRDLGTTNWLVEINRIATNYFPARHSIFLGQLTAAGLYPSVAAPSFSQFGGRVARGFNLFITNNAGAGILYYTTNGADPRMFGTAAVAPTAATYTAPVALNASAVVKARVLNGGIWSALTEASFTVGTIGTTLRVTEIMYNPTGGDAYEFIELQNVGPAAIDVGNFSFSGITYLFPPNTTLAAGAVIVLGSSSSPANWTNRYPGVNVFARFDGNLSNGGEKLAILDRTTNIVYSVDYDDENGWPAAADGAGFSLEVIDPLGNPDDPANWRASSVLNGTPGTVTPPPAPGLVFLNEVMAENVSAVTNGDTLPDWVELYNSSTQAVTLAGWSLTDDSNPRKFVFPGGTTLSANGYLVVWCDSVTNVTPGLHSGFSLGRGGDNVFLYDANSNRVDAITFGLQLPDYTIGRVGDVWQLTRPTPNATNQVVALAAATNLVINEFLANSVPGGDDWVELYNRATNAPVSLRDIYLSNVNATFQLKALSFIPAAGFVQLFADEKSGAAHLDFKLPATGGAIVLYDETGLEINRITYAAQLQGVSQGRLPDGSGAIVSFPTSASPGASNYLLTYTGAMLNEIMAVNHSALTNANGWASDWIELINTNAAPYTLAGMRLSTDVTKPDQWVFPAGTTVPANGFFVVWFDDAHPASLMAEAVLNTGHALDGDSGEVYLFNSVGQPVDSVAYGFQVQNLSIGRASGQWTLLLNPTPGAPNSGAAFLGTASTLKLNEWMANPTSGNDWFEIYNSGILPVQLTSLFLANNADSASLTAFQIAPLSYIGAKGFVKCVADADLSQGRNHVNFNLDKDGEVLRLSSAALGIIDTIYFGSQSPGVSQGRLLDGDATIVSFPTTPTPGESNYLPLSGVVVNEVLTHTDPPLEDAVEFANTTLAPVSIGGWYLSNSRDNLKKYRIPNGTSLLANGFIVLYENQFNSTNATVPFTFNSAHGDEVWLSQADALGNLNGYRSMVALGASANGVSFGRYQTTEGIDYTALSQRTFGADAPVTLGEFRTGTGATNAYPKVGPLVINEIMYHPPDIGGTNDDTLNEFVELYNLSDSTVQLFDPANPTNQWRLQDGISYTFPSNTTMAAGSYMLVVNFDPAIETAQLAAFRTRYGVAPAVPIFGPYGGKLDNGGEAVEIARPDAPQGAGHPDVGFVPYITVDRVVYSDESPWPSAGDGSGASLQRRSAASYGNEPLNWLAGPPTPSGTNGGSSIALPVITQPPVNTGGMAGTNVTFSVTATGGSPLSYQWRFNGVSILQATNRILAIVNIQSVNEGGYTVLVSNPDGSALSSAATLSVEAPPAITQQPLTQAASAGANATFSVLATGGGLNYQWRFKGVNLTGSTGSTLNLTNVQGTNVGAYSVVVSNLAGVLTSADAYLVIAAPVITVQPLGQTNNIGTTITLSVTATGDAPLGYQWRRNSLNINGATNSTFVITNAQYANLGSYDVIVANAAGTVASAIAYVTFYPRITQQPQSLSVTNGTNATFTVVASGSGTLRYQWRFNGTNITNVPSATASSLSLTNVQISNSGDYTVVVSDDLTSLISQTATLTVLLKPIIVTQPVSLATPPGGTVVFSVGMIGTLPMAYQWRSNNVLVVGESGPTLTIVNAQFTGTTNRFYRVNGSNAAGLGPLSSLAYLVVQAPPMISLQPTNLVVDAGTNVMFSVAASGPPVLAYQWQFSGTNLANATNTSLSLTNVQLTNAGTYKVVVTNGYGSVTSQVATLTLRVPPYIITQPTSQTVKAGSPASFNVQAGGAAPLRYQWKFNDGNLAGETNSSLSLGNAQSGNEGSYVVVITNSLGSVTSLLATLTVQVPPAITSPPANQTVIAGSDVTFGVTASGAAPLSYQWRLGNNEILGATSAMLALINVQVGSQGNYSVVVTNSVGSVTSAVAILTVLVPPTISAQPVSQTVIAGSNATFSVAADGSAPLRYQWLHDTATLTDATNATLTLTNVQPASAGGYAVVITNAAGAGTSAVATLTVLVPPTITLQPTDQAGGIGSNVTFNVTADGTAPLSLQWKFNESILAGAINATLVLTNLQIADEGHYSVVITNQAGSVASQSAYLSILIQPVLSQPQLLVEGDFQAWLRGNTNRSYLIEFSTNLVNWFTLTNLTYTNVQVPFTDSATTNSAQRFYRARLAP